MFPCNSNIIKGRIQKVVCLQWQVAAVLPYEVTIKQTQGFYFLLCVHAGMWGSFSSSSQGSIKGEKDNMVFLHFVAEELEWLVQQDGKWKMAPEICSWSLSDCTDIRLPAHPLSHLGRTDTNGSFSCRRVDRKGQGEKRAGKGNWAEGEEEGEMWLLQEFTREFLLQVVWQWGGKACGWRCSHYLKSLWV